MQSPPPLLFQYRYIYIFFFFIYEMNFDQKEQQNLIFFLYLHFGEQSVITLLHVR